jgi:glycosyltransferase involved in cell wall biosynthesis
MNMANDLTSDVRAAATRPRSAPADPQPGRSRILHINNGNLYGGVETILVTLARLRSLCPAMESHYALCEEGRLSHELAEAGAPVYTLGTVRISRPWTVWRARRRLLEILNREKFDLVICHMPWSLAVFGPAVNAAAQTLGFWAHAFHEGTGWLEHLARRARPDLAIANSRYTEAGCDNLFPHVPHAVVYPPVALTASSETAASRSQLRRHMGVAENTVVIIQVSRMEAWKGHVSHIKALAQLQELPTHWVCWMVGGAQRPEEQKYLHELAQLTADLGIGERVQFLGQRSDVTELLSAADVFCQPNQTPEPFGITSVEALWAGRPVIAGALGGTLEVIDDSCGRLVSPGDVEALAEALKRMIESREIRERLGQAGPARAVQLCDPARQMDLLHRLSQSGARLALQS